MIEDNCKSWWTKNREKGGEQNCETFLYWIFSRMTDRGSYPIVLSCQIKWAFYHVVQTMTVEGGMESIIHDTKSHLLHDSHKHTHTIS